MNNKTKALSEGIFLTGNKSRHRYEILEYLGRGGFGITYLAQETVLVDGIPQKHKYTIKEFCLSDICVRESDGALSVDPKYQEEFKESMTEFRKEADHIKEMKHEGIVPVSEVFEANNTVYYVMQFLGDTSLADLIKLKGGALNEQLSIDIIRKVAASLDYLHQHMMTHLDVKPDNIMMLDLGKDSWQPVLIDFGLSCHYGKNGTITSKEIAVGTSKGYSPMEQYVTGGVRKFTPQADIYALGATLFCMLTGKAPIISSDISTKYIYSNLPDATSERTSKAIVMAMQKNLEDRPATMTEFLQLFEKKVEQDISERHDNNVTERGKKAKKKKKPFDPKYLYGTIATIFVIAALIFAFQKFQKSTCSHGNIVQGDSLSTDTIAIPSVDPSPVPDPEPNPNPTPTPNPVPNPNPAPSKRFKDLGYAEWYGDVVNGKPDGEGKLVFKSNHIIEVFDPEKRQAESGDFIEGLFENGHLVSGKWYGADGNKKQSIYIGGQ